VHGTLDTRRAWEKCRRVQESGAERSRRPPVLPNAGGAGYDLRIPASACGAACPRRSILAENEGIAAPGAKDR